MTTLKPKRVVSVSLGSTKRDKTVSVTFFDQPFEISRVGTNGDQELFKKKIAELDGTIDAFGFGGMDQYLWSDGKRYEFAPQRRSSPPQKKRRY